MKISSKVLSVTSICYIYLPVALFLFGWTNRITSAVASATILFCMIRLIKNIRKENAQEDTFRVHAVVFIFAVLLFLWVGYYAGWGRWTAQTSDWKKHNAVLSDLVNKRWPVMYRNGKEHSMLSYYIGYYLVPAFAGKLAHSFRTAEKMMYLWGVAGLILVYLNLLCRIRSEKTSIQILSAVMIPFFGLPLWLSELVLKRLTGINRLGQTQWFYSEGGIKLQYSNNYTLLAWVVPQVIVCWLIFLLFLRHKENIESYLFIILPAMLFGTFSFLGMVPIAIAYAVEWGVKKKQLSALAKKVFSPDNIAMLFTLGAVFLLYFYGNVLSEKPDGMGFHIMEYGPGQFILYIVFTAVNIWLYMILLWKDHKTDMIYYAVFVSLSLLPLFSMGTYNDLMMRSSIPGLFAVLVYVLEFADKYGGQNMAEPAAASSIRAAFAGISQTAILLLVLVGMYYSFYELSFVVSDEDYHALGNDIQWDTMEHFANRGLKIREELRYNYFAYDIDDNVFYRYLADKPEPEEKEHSGKGTTESE